MNYFFDASLFVGGVFAARALSGYYVQLKAAAGRAKSKAKAEYAQYVAKLHASLANGRHNTLYAAAAAVVLFLGYYLGHR